MDSWRTLCAVCLPAALMIDLRMQALMNCLARPRVLRCCVCARLVCALFSAACVVRALALCLPCGAQVDLGVLCVRIALLGKSQVCCAALLCAALLCWCVRCSALLVRALCSALCVARVLCSAFPCSVLCSCMRSALLLHALCSALLVRALCPALLCSALPCVCVARVLCSAFALRALLCSALLCSICLGQAAALL